MNIEQVVQQEITHLYEQSETLEAAFKGTPYEGDVKQMFDIAQTGLTHIALLGLTREQFDLVTGALYENARRDYANFEQARQDNQLPEYINQLSNGARLAQADLKVAA